MTTNTVEKLDPALIRPGRVDRMVEFKYATKKQGHKLFSRFYPSVRTFVPHNSHALSLPTPFPIPFWA
jgi:hypothetical protein